MMLERHYDEESLIALLHTGDASASRDPHLSSCTSCADMLESYRVISDVLGAKIVWDLQETPDDAAAARGVAAIRAFADSMESEEKPAVALVSELLSSPRQWWVATVERDDRYHSAGVVRHLIEVSEAKIDTMPPEAIETAAAAIAIANTLGDAEHIRQLHGTAYRQHAFALMYTGAFPRALASIECAQAIFDKAAVSDYAMARLNIVRALVYRAQERYSEALALARESAAVFRAFGDTQRLASAMMTEAILFIQLRNYHEALPILTEINRRFGNVIDVDTRARAHNNIAICQKALGRVADAVQSYQLAEALFDELGAVSDCAMIRYNIALLLAAEGQPTEGRKRMREARAEFDRLGLVHFSVITGLDLAEFAVLENDFQEVEELCRTAIRQFETAGVTHSSEALTALTFLREAAEQRRATQEIVWHVRTYIKRLPDEPALLFAPAPLPPT
jgi:tetratricopeptide (TPR) repeat protein